MIDSVSLSSLELSDKGIEKLFVATLNFSNKSWCLLSSSQALFQVEVFFTWIKINNFYFKVFNIFQLIIDTKVVLVIRMHTRISSNIGVTSVVQGLGVSNILLQNSRARFTQYAVCALHRASNLRVAICDYFLLITMQPNV